MSASAVNSELAGNVSFYKVISHCIIEEKIIQGLDGIDTVILWVNRFFIADDRSVFNAVTQVGDLSQAALAREVGVTRCSVSYWCNGRMIPCGEHLEKLAKIFETSPRRLLGYTLEHKESDDIGRTSSKQRYPVFAARVQKIRLE